MTSNPAQPTPEHQPGGPQLAWRGAPQPPWPGPQPPWSAPARQDPPDSPQPARRVTLRQNPPDSPQPARRVTLRQDPPHDGPVLATAPGNGRAAAIGYFGVPILGPLAPLAVYLLRGRTSDYARRHSVQALNLWLTAALYGVCTLIAGGVLALDSIGVALVVVIVVAAALWLATLGYAVAAGLRADRGGFRRIPAWLCATIVR